jgi:hypothetical protein
VTIISQAQPQRGCVPDGFTMLQSQLPTTVISARWLRIDPFASRPAAATPIGVGHYLRILRRWELLRSQGS